MYIYNSLWKLNFVILLQRAGIHKLIPGMVIDDYLFEPCGYSMNGIGKNNVSIFEFSK